MGKQIQNSQTMITESEVGCHTIQYHHYDVISAQFRCVIISNCSPQISIKTLLNQSLAIIRHSGLVSLRNEIERKTIEILHIFSCSSNSIDQRPSCQSDIQKILLRSILNFEHLRCHYKCGDRLYVMASLQSC